MTKRILTLVLCLALVVLLGSCQQKPQEEIVPGSNEARAVIRNLRVDVQLTDLGAFDVAGTSELDGGITVDDTAFVVTDATGSISTAGDLDVAGTSELDGGLTVDDTNFSVNATTGAVATASTLDVASDSELDGGITVDDTNFIVHGTTGAVTTASTLDVAGGAELDGGFTVDDTAFIVADTTGATTIAGALAANGGINMDYPAFYVANTTGNAYIAGTLQVTGTSTLGVVNAGAIFPSSAMMAGTLTANAAVVTGTITAGGATITGDVTVSGNVTTTGTSTHIGSETWTGTATVNAAVVTTTLSVGGLLSANGGVQVDYPAWYVSDTSGNTYVNGTLQVTGTTTLGVAYAGNIFPDDVMSGGTITADVLVITNTITASGLMAANKGFEADYPAFYVADTSGNVYVSGTLQVTGTSTLGVVNAGATFPTSLMTGGAVTAASTVITGALTSASVATGAVTATSIKSSGQITLATWLALTQQNSDVAIEVTNGAPITPTGTLQTIYASAWVTTSATTAVVSGTMDGQIVILHNTGAEKITVKTGANTLLGADRVLDVLDTLILFWFETGAVWYILAFEDNSP